jgi:acyl-CoA synthetase (AMP-forming)/AMP-acid ligase II
MLPEPNPKEVMMKDLRTIPKALEAAAEKRPDAGFTFVEEGGDERFWSFAKLDERARGIAVALAERGIRKRDRVALVLPKAEEFVAAFFGAAYAGAIPVPLYPPTALGRIAGYLDHCAHVVNSSSAKLLVTTQRIADALGEGLRGLAPTLETALSYDELYDGARLYRDAGVALEDVAYVQFTSGSTARPKGVVVTHHNLASNTRAIMRETLRIDEERDRAVSWLPLFHDMGLIGFVKAPVMHPISVTLMQPLAFARRPARWLKLLSKHRATITCAPNFAYAHATKRVKEEEIAGIDLSALRAAGCAAPSPSRRRP